MENFSDWEVDSQVYQEKENHRLAAVTIMEDEQGRMVPMWRRDWKVRSLIEQLHAAQKQVAALEAELYSILLNADEE